MVPGWCGDRTVFGPLLPRMSRRHRTLALDLPEHGGNARTGRDFGTADVVDDLVAVADQSGLDRVVPVTLSHAGWMAIELRRRLGPSRVPGIVLLDWMPLGPPPGFVDALEGLQRGQAWEQVRSGLFSMWTSGVDVRQVHDYVGSMAEYGYPHWRRAGREIAAAFAANGSPVAALDALDEPCPTLHVYAQPADDDYLAAQHAYAADHPWFTAYRLDARSHFPTFEVPAQIADVVEEFVCRLR